MLLADQWIQTGGTMEAAIALAERQNGIVAGHVRIAMETCPATQEFLARFPVVTAVMPGSRWQAECDAQVLTSFLTYDPSQTFPTAGRSTLHVG